MTKPQFISPLTQAHFSIEKDDNKKHNKTVVKRDPNHSRNEAKRARLEAESIEEQRLTNLLFGGSNVAGDNATSAAWYDEDDDGEMLTRGGDTEDYDDDEEELGGNHGVLFQIDRKGADIEGINGNEDGNVGGEEDENVNENDKDSSQKAGQASAWVDEDDENLTISLQKMDRVRKLRSSLAEDLVTGSAYEEKLRERYQTTMSATSRTDWAKLPQSTDDDESYSEENNYTATKLLSSTASLLSNTRLQPNILNIVRCPDANVGHYNNSTLNAVNFHPGSDEDEPLLLTAGLDKTLRFFKINGSEGGEKIHGVHFPHLPIHCASFLGNTGNVVVSGRRSFFYIYDAVAGKMDKIPRIQGRKEKSLEKFTTSPDGNLIAFIGNDGYIVLVEAKSKMWVADLKMNGSARAVSFSPDGQFIFASGSDGEVYRWDIRTKRCVDRFKNEDGTISSFLSVSNKFTAVGAESGVVNIYNNSIGQSFQNRSPLKSIMNMHTSVDYMKFNPNGDILAMSSRREKDSLKLVHMPTQTVFSNWPTSKTPLSYVWSLDFSPSSKFMAIGNDKGRCLLYKLSHYHG